MLRVRAVDVGRIALVVVAAWISIVVVGNVLELLSSTGIVSHAPLASGNLAFIQGVLTKLALAGWSTSALVLATLLELVAALALWAAAVHRSPLLEDAGFGLLVVLFGAFVALDDLAVSYTTEAVHRSLVVYVAILYLVVRFTRAPAA